MLVKISEKSINIIYRSSPNLPDFLRKWLLTNAYLVYKYNLVNNKIDSKKLSCNFHLDSFYLVNRFFRQSERERNLFGFENRYPVNSSICMPM